MSLLIFGIVTVTSLTIGFAYGYETSERVSRNAERTISEILAEAAVKRP